MTTNNPAAEQVQSERMGQANTNIIETTDEQLKENGRESMTQGRRGKAGRKEEEKRGEGGWMLPGHGARWCLKCSGVLFPLLSLLMSLLCSCVFYTPCDGRSTPPSRPSDGSVLFYPAIHHCM